MQIHHPVMLAEALDFLAASLAEEDDELSVDRLFVDATLGLGGHTEAILRASPRNRVIGFDRDAEAIGLARDRLAEFGGKFEAVHTDYRQIKSVLVEKGINSVAGILADLGISSFQVDTLERGFSFRAEAPLDMRMDRSQEMTAAKLVNSLSERELADIIFEYGEERAARRIARQIVIARAKTPITTTSQLAELVVRVVHPPGRWKTHPATRTFQALRIAVNRELENLEGFVADAVDLLETGGRLVIITFHSLEDRLIKQALKFQSGQCVCPPNLPDCQCGAVRRVEILTRKAIQPSPAEVEANPRARSARLRACRKL
ncbi:MAG TPA: 16S rRNA (cytosine(1402)-N(4))-methyltransferase RsmH [Blastocatellia bacterium]|nr:16S rRNA (cytosine(1402)-N(4))-methyltransferase RsmH [Blastocatellia bacterium]